MADANTKLDFSVIGGDAALRGDYERRFGANMKQRLLDLGVLAFDPSVRNFMHWKGLL